MMTTKTIDEIITSPLADAGLSLERAMEKFPNIKAEVEALITEAKQQIAINMAAQWRAERIYHTLSTPVEECKRELDHFQEFSAKFIAQLIGGSDE